MPQITIQLKFRGIDDFHRAVFKDINTAHYYGDCNCTKTGKPKEVINFYKNNTKLLEYFGTSFNCEPNGELNSLYKLEIVD